jgi:putative redox protein
MSEVPTPSSATGGASNDAFTPPPKPKSIHVSMKRINDAMLVEATNETGATLRLDGSQDIGGVNGGFSPMQALVAAAGGCSVIDIVMILNKQKLPIQDLTVEIDATRDQMKGYTQFSAIHLRYDLVGDIPQDRAERAMKLSVEKYCSVLKTLEKTADITAEIHVTQPS